MSDFSRRIITWQREYGRHDLPWQNTRDPYAIWVSEIMLQQTQVGAVIPYYQRFMARFPDIASLAAAGEDEVLQHWSGLGYYSRARNLHAAARQLMEVHGGRFPALPEHIRQLPGIGRSTAAAIAAFAFGHHAAILDGNVKRVLARHGGVDGWPGLPAVDKQLWSLAESLLPTADIEAYTQGLMDLGASLCRRGKPDCGRCPLQADCVAHHEKRTAALPAPRPRKPLPERAATLLLLLQGNEVLLEKRPSTGIWGGLWSLPETGEGEDACRHALERFGLETRLQPAMPVLTHTFTHFRLRITPQPLRVVGQRPTASNAGNVWLDIEDAAGAAVPAPVRRLLEMLRTVSIADCA